MALIVALNKTYGLHPEPTFGYWDPLTGVNLTLSNPTSGDLSGFTASQLTNVMGAVQDGRLVVTSGAMPAASGFTYVRVI